MAAAATLVMRRIWDFPTFEDRCCLPGTAANSGGELTSQLPENQTRLSKTYVFSCAIPAQSPFIPADAKIVVGAVAPASPDPIPIVLLPGFEYRLREWRHPDTHEVHWLLERRKSAQQGEDDDSPTERRTTTCLARRGPAGNCGSRRSR